MIGEYHAVCLQHVGFDVSTCVIHQKSFKISDKCLVPLDSMMSSITFCKAFTSWSFEATSLVGVRSLAMPTSSRRSRGKGCEPMLSRIMLKHMRSHMERHRDVLHPIKIQIMSHAYIHRDVLHPYCTASILYCIQIKM